MSGRETFYSPTQCDRIIERGIILTPEAWKLLKGDIQSNCQFAQCDQITGAADGLFLTVDRALQKIPIP